jgi:uncharacterized membrane protein
MMSRNPLTLSGRTDRSPRGRHGGVDFIIVARSPYNRHPLPPLFAGALALLAAVLVALFVLNAIAYAYRRIGISEGALFGLVWLSLVGGFINIPVARLRGQAQRGVREIVAFGVRYRVPVLQAPAPTTLAVNLGGAVIPAALSVFLLIKDDIWWQSAVAVLFVAAVVHMIARPIAGLGIAVPALAPPLLAAVTALIISPTAPAALAYIAGSLGTLIGADIVNVGKVRELGAGVASIGGAGTFDGVFLSGIVAVLLVGVT